MGLPYSKISTLSHTMIQSTNLGSPRSVFFFVTEFVILPCVSTNNQFSSYRTQMLSLDTIHLVKVDVTPFPKRNSILTL